MKTFLMTSLLAVMALASDGATPGFYDDFESIYIYTVGQTLNSAVNGWQASGDSAYVTNNGGHLGSWAAFMSGSVALTNTQNADSNLKIWTDFRIKPMLGTTDLLDIPTNTSSCLYYFNRSGVVVVATASGWHECTNDVWGNSVPAVSAADYVRVSIFQDFGASTQAVFINDRLVIQDMPFVGSVEKYNQLIVRNTDSNCWLDNMWVKTNFDTATLTNNFNTDSHADAWEVKTYGHAARTLYVCQSDTNLVPLFPSITSAVAVWRPRDIIHVVAGNYSSENVSLLANPSNVVFQGDSFVVNSLTVASNASVSFAQTVACGTLTLTGLVAMAGGTSMTSVTAHVVGNLSVADGGAFVVTSLDVGANGIISFTSAQLVANTVGVNMNGTFAISNTWGSVSAIGIFLPFEDNFDLYAENTVMTNLHFRGWNASDERVKVQSAVSHNDKAVVLPDGVVLSNSIIPTATKIWTDFYLQAALGGESLAPPTNTSSFLAYVNSDGWLVVATGGGGWVVCSNQLDGTLSTPIQSNVFTRVTVCQDLSVSPPRFAVFVASNLVAQGLSSPANIAQYSSFAVDNRDGTAYVDGASGFVWGFFIERLRGSC